MKKGFIFGAAAAAIAAVTVMSATATGFAKTNTYTSGMFGDVPAEQWYAGDVASSYELGFMKGTADGVFSPTGNMTVAEAITIASRVHDAYNAKNTVFDISTGTNWYDCYVNYAVEQGIIANGQFDNYGRNITRAEMALVFSKAVPSSYLTAKNEVGKIPDVPSTNSYFDELLMLYKAGVVMGSDEFGTFKPNNNIIRAEAAAIINRVALPENRLSKTLVDADYGDAYYLINDMSASFNTSDVVTSTTSAWVTDNRFNDTGSAGNALADLSETSYVSVWRDIDDVTEGLVGFEAMLDLIHCESGTSFEITDDSRKPLWTLETKDGNYFFQGTDTGVGVQKGYVFIKVKANLDNHTASLYINGKQIGDTFNVNNVTASRFYINSSEEATSVVTVSRFAVYKDYVVNDMFLDPEEAELSQWEVTGSGKVVYTGGNSENDVNSAQLTGKSQAKQSFAKAISGKVVFETLMLFPEAADTGYISLNSGNKSAAKIKVNADGVFNGNGTKLRFHNNNIWQTLRIEADTVNQKVVYWVNGKKMGTGNFNSYVTSVDNITIGSESGKVFFDDVKVFLEHEYDDYCPTPVPITDDGYDVVLNVCSLWHEGIHWGWGRESAYEDIEPALGYYDEGIPEVNDWEIKFMVENGIDVQHFCWYTPSKDTKEPIKKPSLVSHALHDGFFYSEYSDMMKFNFMWENSNVDCSNFENFKEYIWKYWVDYYFLDERFYKIDNKVVITAWNVDNFKKVFGGTNEAAKEAIDFMNEDLKKYGLDGIMIFFADQHRTDAGYFQSMSDMGASGAYAYHWQQDGNNAQGTLKRLFNNQNHGKIHILPVVSVGFNNIGWSGVRKPLISLSDHKGVLDYIKNDYLTKQTGWKSKTLLVSNWNEYGEGTYVMPVPGLHGFGYIENIAEVISGVTDHSNNIYPTEQQKARLGHLYPKSKTSLERLDIEKASTTANLATIYKATGDDFVDGRRIADSSISKGVYKATVTEKDAASYINQAKRFEPVDTAKVSALRLVIRANVKTYSELFFLTEDSPSEKQEYSFGFYTNPTDDFVEVLVDTSTNENWMGTLTNIRFDIISAAGTYEIKEFELLGPDESKTFVDITVNANEYMPTFTPEERNGEVYVTTEAEKSFFSLHHLYYEWSRFTGELLIENAKKDRIVFTVGSDIAVVNGKQKKLAEKVTLRDGLPEIPLFVLYDAMNITYDREDSLIKAYVVYGLDEKEFLDVMRSRIPYEYEFRLPGDDEGFMTYGSSMVIEDGFLKGVAQAKSNGTFDPIVTRETNLNIKAADYNKVVVGMKHKLPEGMERTVLNLFFTTDTDGTLDANKLVTLRVNGNSSDDKVIEYVFDCTGCPYWRGIIKQFRVDPIGGEGEFEIDYIRIQYDDQLRINREKLIAEMEAKGLQILNGDGEDEANAGAFFGDAKNAVVSIVKDEETGSNVINVVPVEPYAYVNQKAVFGSGNKYSVTMDVKLTKTASGKTEGVNTTFHANMQYEDSPGKMGNHLVVRKPLTVEDGWQTITFTFSVPVGVQYNPNELFSFYTNPYNGEGVGYMIDNIVVEKLN